ncbi:hypothetical protein MD484_g8096, partial [Candolleomyces efflorescens]
MNKGTRQSNKNFKGEKAAAATEKARKAKSQAQGAHRAAQLEHEARQKAAAQRSKSGSVHSKTPNIEKQEQKRPRPEDSLDVGVEKPSKRKKRVVYISDDDDDVEDAGDEAIVESECSGEEFIPDQDDSDEESDEDVEMEEEEADTVIEKKKKKTSNVAGKKKGVTARSGIRELRDGMSTLSEIPTTKDTQTARAKSQKKRAKGKGKSEPSGLRSNWDQDADPLFPPGPLSAGRRGGTSSVSSDFTSPPPTDAEENEDDGPAQQGGGFLDDDDDDEVEFRKSMKSQYKARSIAKIEPLDNAPKIFKKVSKTSKRPKVGDLPQEARSIWRFFKVVIVDSAGQLGPWEDVADHTIEKTWNAIFENKGDFLIGRTPYRGRDEHELFQIVKALTRNQVLATEWKNRFAAAGVDAVNAEWDRRNLITIEERKEWVERMLGPEPTNRQSRNRPFLWKATDSEEWKGEDPNLAGGGLFLGRMVLKVFAEHISFVCDAPAERKAKFTPSPKPRGALMMAVQAVNRALEYSLSGQVKIPLGNDKTGHFSEDNWGDFEKLTIVDGEEFRKPVRRATVFAKTIDTMDDQRWAKIIKAAKAYIGKKGPDRYDRGAPVGNPAKTSLQRHEARESRIDDELDRVGTGAKSGLGLEPRDGHVDGLEEPAGPQGSADGGHNLDRVEATGTA